MQCDKFTSQIRKLEPREVPEFAHGRRQTQNQAPVRFHRTFPNLRDFSQLHLLQEARLSFGLEAVFLHRLISFGPKVKST